MKRQLLYLLTFVTVVLCTSCHDIPDYGTTRADNFRQLWDIVDRRYCFFQYKNLDWDSVYRVYAPRAANAKTDRELFGVCSEMLAELRDGHVNLSSSFATSYYRKWWTDYPQDFDARVIEQNYFNFGYINLGPVIYSRLPQNVGYVRISTFSSGLGEGNIDAILSMFGLCNGLIVDVRDNGGGDITNAQRWASRFIKERTLAGYISHKTGTGHADFSRPYAYYIDPTPAPHLLWNKPVVVLTNRSTFSAANNFVSIMAQLPQVTLVGAVTGGGSGMPMSYELQNGWGVRLSAAPILDAQGRDTEFGIAPHVAVTMTPADAAAGIDPILDRAVELLSGGTAGPDRQP